MTQRLTHEALSSLPRRRGSITQIREAMRGRATKAQLGQVPEDLQTLQSWGYVRREDGPEEPVEWWGENEPNHKKRRQPRPDPSIWIVVEPFPRANRFVVRVRP